MKRSSRIRVGICASALVLLAAISWLGFQNPSSDIILFNQFELNDLALERGTLPLSERLLVRLSKAGATLQSLLRRREGVEYDSFDSVQSYVFRYLPPLALILPTEGYYYFRIPSPEGMIAGNLRFTDIEDGKVGFSYYLPGDLTKKGHSNLLIDGKNASFTKFGERVWLVCIAGWWKVFILPRIERTPPLELTLLDGEEFYASMTDESGTPLWVIFKNHPPSFVYVRDARRSMEEFRSEDDLLVGMRSKFVFKDFGLRRQVLVGVSRDEVSKNSYFDGPFDQLPARIDIRRQLYRAYPYLKIGGIDEFGYFCLNRSVRAAVSPYIQYRSLDEIRRTIDECGAKTTDPNLMEHCVTFDDKQANHLSSSAFTKAGELIEREPSTCIHH